MRPGPCPEGTGREPQDIFDSGEQSVVTLGKNAPLRISAGLVGDVPVPAACFFPNPPSPYFASMFTLPFSERSVTAAVPVPTLPTLCLASLIE